MWYEQPITSKQFKNGYNKFAFDNEEQAREILKKYFTASELVGALKIPENFGNNSKFVVRLPNSALRCVVGKTKYCYGFKAAWVQDFAISEPFEV